VYAANTRFGCYVEVLAHFRPDPELVADMANIDVEDLSPVDQTLPAGEIDLTWAERRAVTSARMGGTFCDVTAAATVAALRPFFIEEAYRLGLPDFDAAALKLAHPRELTQKVASFVYEMPSPGDDNLFAGIRFASRHGDEIPMWALFERDGDVPVSRRLTVLTEEGISPSDPELQAAMALHGLRWPGQP
jgi:hypothetical protein